VSKTPKKTSDPLDESLHSAAGSTYLKILDHPGHLIRRLHQISVSVFTKAAEEYDVTQVQYAALTVVELLPGVDQSRLGNAVALDRQTISNVVQRLCEKGLLERRQKNKRTNALFLTGASRALLRVVRNKIGKVDDTLLAPLTDRERDQFMKSLRKLVNSNNKLSRAPYRSI
jgi:DNA-binding MarR family transcriptional regulator